MSTHVATQPDWSWLSEISNRRAVLWVGHSFDVVGVDDPKRLAEIAAHSWHSIYADSFSALDFATADVPTAQLEPLTLRLVEGDPDDVTLASNRVPVYAVPQSDISNPVRTLARLKMFQRLPTAGTVFVLTHDPEQDLVPLGEALQVSSGARRVVVVCPSGFEHDLDAVQLVHWQTDLGAFKSFLDNLAPPADRLTRDATIMLTTDDGVRPVDLSHAVDPSYSISERFAFIPASQVLADVKPSEELLEELLSANDESWKAYRARIPFDRSEPFLKDLRHLFNEFRKRGPDATCTAWIEAEQASGATTLLRIVLLKLAEQGYPILVARPSASTFDFQQLTSFMRSAAAVADRAKGRIGEVPWIVAFDVEHLLRSDEFILGLANGLRKLGHTTLVIGIRPIGASIDSTRFRATGSAHTLGFRLENVISRDEAVSLGTYLNQFLPVHQRRSAGDWRDFCGDAERLTGDGRQSLFWVALRFWLLRYPAADESLRAWIASKLRSATAGSPAALKAIVETAVLSRYRLAMPSRLLDAEGRAALIPLLDDPTQPIGLRELWSGRFGAYVFAHPLIAEEILRICASDVSSLERLEIGQCASLLDLELSIFERIMGREAAGYPEVLPIIEEIAMSALRVDPREAPRNYTARERIVMLLELVPDSVFDGSQLFLHHLAKARRHLAADPPDTEHWSHAESIREQLDLAASHLIEAMTSTTVSDPDRIETPLNLHVSLALTYDVRGRFEREHGCESDANEFIGKAQHEYEIAQGLDPDNTYVLENFARLKLRIANQEITEASQLELVVDAISLLDWELAVDEEKRRESAVLEVLAQAYKVLSDDVGLARLETLALAGSEAAAVALARLLTRPPSPDSAESDDYARAVDLLRQVPAEAVTWRSRLLLYQLLSHIDPAAFADRLEALDELRATRDFAWPLQVLMEYGILLHQMGRREDGQAVYREVRDQLSGRSAAVTVPTELKYLADPKSEFREPLRTSIVVTNTSSAGRNYYGIPAGWGNVSIPFRPYLFAKSNIRVRDDMDCLIQFTTFGPMAVPRTEL